MRFETHGWLFFSYNQFAFSWSNLLRHHPKRWSTDRPHMYLKGIHHLHVKDFESMGIDFRFPTWKVCHKSKLARVEIERPCLKKITRVKERESTCSLIALLDSWIILIV